MQCAALILFNEAFSVSLWRLRDADMTSFLCAWSYLRPTSGAYPMLSAQWNKSLKIVGTVRAQLLTVLD